VWAIVERKAVEHPVFLLQAAKYWLLYEGIWSKPISLVTDISVPSPYKRIRRSRTWSRRRFASIPRQKSCSVISVSHSWYLAFAFRLRPLPARRVILLVHFERSFLVNFSVKIRHQNQVSLIDVSGHLTFFEVGALGSSIQSLLKERRKNILLNLSGLAYLDSSGIGELARMYVAVVKQGGAMKVIGLTPKVEEVLKITHLSQVFQEFPDEQSALRSFPANS